MNFTDPVYATELHIHGLIDRVNVSHVLSSVLRKDAETSVFNDMEFDRLIIEGNLNLPSGLVNGVNFTALNQSVLRLNADEVLESNLEFNNVRTTVHLFHPIKSFLFILLN